MTNEEKSHVNDVKIAILENNNFHLHETLHRIENNLIEFKTEIKNEINRVEKNTIDFKAEVKNEFSEIRKEINEVRKESLSHFRWLIGTMIIFSGSPIIVESVKLIINILRH